MKYYVDWRNFKGSQRKYFSLKADADDFYQWMLDNTDLRVYPPKKINNKDASWVLNRERQIRTFARRY